MAAWAVKAVLATGPWGVAVIVGGAGLFVLRLRRVAAWLGSLPGRARRRVTVRRARRRHIRALERMFRD
jgi:hypothetical protein